MQRLTSTLLLSVLLLVAGCNTGSRSSKSSASTAAPSTSNTTPGTTNQGPPSATASGVALASSEARMGADVVALALNVAAAGSGASELASLVVKASGSVDESQAIGEVKLIEDANGNGQLDQGEAVLATAASPAFSADDGSVTLTLATPASVAPGASLQLLVLADASAMGQVAAGRIGQTIALSVEAAGDLTITSGGQPVSAGGSFPIAGGPVTLFVHDHLLISELVPGFGNAYVELFNPTAQAIDLSGYYLSDADDYSSPKVNEYYNVPTGANFMSGSAYDAIVRFPAGATIAPGAYAVVAIDGAAFQTAYGQAPDFYLRAPTAGAEQMLTPDSSTPANWVAAPVGTQVYLFTGGEPLILFFWDGQSDLVQDVDSLYLGTVTTSASGDPHDKTGVQVDGPDTDTTPSTFLADTAAGQQASLTGGGPWQRVDYTEAGEAATGGNGITGNDEMSEPVGLTFTSGTATPGAP